MTTKFDIGQRIYTTAMGTHIFHAPIKSISISNIGITYTLGDDAMTVCCANEEHCFATKKAAEKAVADTKKRYARQANSTEVPW